jgi:hypothetical protein
MKTHRWLRWQLAGLAFLLAPVGEAADAACPPAGNLCECVGEASKFNIVATGKVSALERKLVYYGYGYLVETYVEGHICGTKVLASGPVGHPTYLTDILATRGAGSVAMSFAKKDPYNDGGYGVSAFDVATGGGKISGEENVEASVIDITGTHPKVPSCQQAILDVQTANATLSAMTPTRDLGFVRVRGDYLDIDADPGVNVWTADRIQVIPRSYYGYPQRASLYINFDVDTEWVIINTGGLTVGELSSIYTSDPEHTIINLVGQGPSVKVGKFGSIEPAVVAPLRNVLIGLQLGDFAIGSVMGKHVRLSGSTAFNGWYFCE